MFDWSQVFGKRQRRTDGNKGDCFVASYKYFVDNFSFDTRARLCHGEPYSKHLGKRIKHAWIERGDIVIDPANNTIQQFSKEKYYSIGDIDPDKVEKYSYEEALKMSLEYETYGPWEDK